MKEVKMDQGYSNNRRVYQDQLLLKFTTGSNLVPEKVLWSLSLLRAWHVSKMLTLLSLFVMLQLPSWWSLSFGSMFTHSVTRVPCFMFYAFAVWSTWSCDSFFSLSVLKETHLRGGIIIRFTWEKLCVWLIQVELSDSNEAVIDGLDAVFSSYSQPFKSRERRENCHKFCMCIEWVHRRDLSLSLFAL